MAAFEKIWPFVLGINFKVKMNSVYLKHSSVNPTEWWNTLKQFVGNLPTICSSVSDHFVGLALKGLTTISINFKSLRNPPNSNEITYFQLINTPELSSK